MRVWFNACLSVSSRVMVIVVSCMPLSRWVARGLWLDCREPGLIVGSECATPPAHP